MLLSSGATAPPAGAAVAGGSLTITGQGGRYSDVSFAHPVRVKPMLLGGSDGWTWSGCGRFRGFYLQPLVGDSTRGVGAVDVASFAYGRAAGAPFPATEFRRVPVPLGTMMLAIGDGQTQPDTAAVTLPRGRYRVYLLGDGACRVTVPVIGLRESVRLSPKGRAALRFDVVPLDGLAAPPAGTPGARTGSVAFPLTVTARTFAIVVLHEVTYSYGLGPNAAASYEICVQPEPVDGCGRVNGTTLPGRTPPGRSGFYHHGSYAPPPVVATPVGVPTAGPVSVPVHQASNDIAQWYAPGWLPTGELNAKVRAAVAPATSMHAALFALDLGR